MTLNKKTLFLKNQLGALAFFGFHCLALHSVAFSAETPSADLRSEEIGNLPQVSLPPSILASAPTGVHDDLRVNELGSTFLNFELAREGKDPVKVTLYGVVFDDCLPYFEFSNSATDPQTLGKGKDESGTKIMGFRIKDVDGHGRQCMGRHRANRDICGKSAKCSYLDQIPANTLAIQQNSDVKVKFGFEPANHNGRKPIEWTDFDENHFANSPKDAFYQGSDSIAREEQNARAAEERRIRKEKESQSDVLFKQARSCRKTHDDRLIALAAVETLGELGLMEVDEMERIQKEVKKAEFRDLTARFNKVSDEDPSELDSAVENLKEYAEENPEVSNEVFTLFHNKASAMVKAHRKPESYDRAEELLNQAGELPEINEKSQKTLKADRTGIRVGRLQAQARTQNGDSSDFWSNYMSTMEDLSSQAQDCFSQGQGMDSSCSSTVQAYQGAAKVPQIAQQAAYERYMFQMQMQQQLYGSMNGMGGMNGMNMGSMNGGMGMMGGMSMGGGSPFFQ